MWLVLGLKRHEKELYESNDCHSINPDNASGTCNWFGDIMDSSPDKNTERKNGAILT